MPKIYAYLSNSFINTETCDIAGREICYNNFKCSDCPHLYELETVTLRTYFPTRKNPDHIDKWRCKCGRQNDYYGGEEMVDECVCGNKVKLQYRRMRGKNY